MTIDPTLYEESYASFIVEAQDVLQRIEQDLLSLKDDRTPAKVHSLMRSAHTLKGAAASVELKSIRQVAHILEDIFKALYNPTIKVEAVETQLFEGYECLRLLLMAEITGGQIDEQEILNRAADVIAKLQETLGDDFDRNAAMPHSSDFGVDVVKSLFEVGVEQRLTELRNAIAHADQDTLAALLQTQADVFLGLAEFSNLPGFSAIAQATLAAVEAHPKQVLTIAQLALQDFTAAQTAVLSGDRHQGGSVSAALQALATTTTAPSEMSNASVQGLAEEWVDDRIEATLAPDVLGNIADEITVSGDQTEDSLSLDQLFGWIDEPDVDPTPARDHERHDVTPASERAVDEWLTPEPLPSPLHTTDAARLEPVRVDIEHLKHLDYLAGELLISQGKQTAQDQQMRVGLQTWRSQLQKHQQTIYELQDCIEKLSYQLAAGTSVFSLNPTLAIASPAPSSHHRFDALELDRYHDLNQLLQASLNEIVQLDDLAEDIEQGNKQGRRSRDHHRRLLNQVRDDLSALRMQPLRDLFNRFPRLLQQLAAAHGKRVELVLTGTHVLVDKAISAQLYDPILHLIRNAFDHGIEPPDQRRRQGKADVGRIEIRATQQGMQTVIDICDDGRGIDLARVAQRAIELNILTPEQASTVPESQLLDILFNPGFSTAPELNELSGRGIGLDVVNNQLQRMNGSIAVSSIPQQGTTFSLKIPLSLATTKLMVFQTAGFTYALPIEQVEQIITPPPNQVQTSIGQPILHWKQGTEDVAIPLYSLAELASYSAISLRISAALESSNLSSNAYLQRMPPKSSLSPVLLLQTIYGRRGLQVDRVLGEYELVIRPLGRAIAAPPYIYGCSVLGNSQSVLVIDIEILMQLTTEVESSPQPALPPTVFNRLSLAPSLAQTSWLQMQGQATRSLPAQANSPSTILVVDDSLTLRQNVTGLLERAGHRVIQAEDGLEALVQLQQHTDICLIICDIEMPRLNGFEFLSQFRQHAHMSTIPVIVLTSRTSAKHQQIAYELGASAYLTKPFNSHQLLTSVSVWLHQSMQT